MSVVDVKTPPHFSHVAFPCGAGLKSPSRSADELGDVEAARARIDSGGRNIFNRRPIRDRQDKGLGNRGRKRFGSFSAQRGNSKRRRFHSERMVLPTKFLLGGNINDPLNLNGLTTDDECSVTPVSSPLPTPMHRREQEIDVIIPPNIRDPLNLNSGEDVDIISPKSHKRKRNKHKRKSDGSIPTGPLILQENPALRIEMEEQDLIKPVSVDVCLDKPEISSQQQVVENKTILKAKVEDKIVSPVIPQISPKSRKRKRQSSECKPDPSISLSKSLLAESVSATKDAVFSPTRACANENQTITPATTMQRQRSLEPKKKFIYGNYNRYYGYRNPAMEEDHRLRCLKKCWFEGKDVLDVGCNVGHFTLALANKFRPRKIVGMDIDSGLIAAARKNIRHYLSAEVANTSKFPEAMSSTYGPIVSKKIPVASEGLTFLNNVRFVQGNFVPETDEIMELVKEQYDVILAFSLTKWIHLNWGDAGLKRAFKKMYKLLRPGGILLLEPQAWPSYKKKKKITDAIHKVFQSIRFKPEQFTKYLLSSEVGFSTCERLDVPFNRSRGFCRGIQIYRKSTTTQNTPSSSLEEPIKVEASGCALVTSEPLSKFGNSSNSLDSFQEDVSSKIPLNSNEKLLQDKETQSSNSISSVIPCESKFDSNTSHQSSL